MNLTDRNDYIISIIQREIANQGLLGKLALEPIPNAFKKRATYFNGKDGLYYFSVFLWQLNKLSDDDLMLEVRNRIAKARRYFSI